MSFTVTLQPGNQQFTLNAGEVILEAALRQGIGLPYGCRGGRCGACVATLHSGEVTYPEGQPSTLENEQADKVAPCMAVAASDLALEVRTVASTGADEIQILPCRVHQIDHLAHDVLGLQLKLPDTRRLQFQAGQYLNFVLSDGRRRAFSIANAPHDDACLELHIRHVDGGKFTDWVFNQMKDRAIMRIEAPLGTFVLDEQSDRPILFIGGGTGFAPLKSQLEHAFYRGIPNPMKLYWGVRAKRDLYLPDLPQQWQKEQVNFDFVPVLSEPDDGWTGRRGFVHEAVLQDIHNLADYAIYMAGPPVMVQAARDAFLQHGVAAERMNYDAFEYAEK